MILLNQSIFVVNFCLAFQVVAVLNAPALFREVYDEKCEVCNKSKPVVFLDPCLHRLCATCAYDADFKNKSKCLVPSCKRNIEYYHIINDNGLCYICKEEASTITIIPCYHKVGNACAYEQKLSQTARCPQCQSVVTCFKGSEPIKNFCQNCYDEIGIKIMKHCYHYIGKNCLNEIKDSTKCPVKNCEQIQDDISENDSEQECCICSLEKSLKVTLIPCNHKICNDCANELIIQKISECPLCREQIVYFNKIELIERCPCREELRHVVLEPCLHKIGVDCADFISNKMYYQPKCPICSKNIEVFRTDGVTVLNVASLFREVGDEKCEVCNKTKPLVFLVTCLHRLCATCAYDVWFKNEGNCLVQSCGKLVYNFEHINDNGLCYTCKEEASSVVLFPCFHKIGNSCAYKQDEQQLLLKFRQQTYILPWKCPQCYTIVEGTIKRNSIKHFCNSCTVEIAVKIMKHCKHYICQICINKNKNFNKCPVEYCEQIQDDSSENDDEEVCFICQFEKPLTVILNPCGHKMCNDCANELLARHMIQCPLCKKEIVFYKNIKSIEKCACKNELRHVVLKPCLHSIGINCAKHISDNNYQPMCPICSKKVELFHTDDPRINNLLNPSSIKHIINVTYQNLLSQKK
ncbi:uncharacterized protein LOC126901514 isoform X2 [Daktulosphaira vitifoliae]|uniref:uncharacterized protein LOC126901514 isoform X2 n=1 Tax=Daktulosphaira vitifoliae TaxID=58002 RepID=UPI0021AB079B|nr:uncharacterized protein LOC126901514 isoform X2 [Daktulosphaira vitifoliae]